MSHLWEERNSRYIEAIEGDKELETEIAKMTPLEDVVDCARALRSWTDLRDNPSHWESLSNVARQQCRAWLWSADESSEAPVMTLEERAKRVADRVEQSSQAFQEHMDLVKKARDRFNAAMSEAGYGEYEPSSVKEFRDVIALAIEQQKGET
jgi:hypothetical protein